MKARQTMLMLAVAGMFSAVSDATAQIIATSIPKGTALEKEKENRLGFHLMIAPLAKWRINVYEEGGDTSTPYSYWAKASPYSTFLIAAEESISLGKGFTLGIGGWYNKVGRTTYDYEEADINSNPLPGTLWYFKGEIDHELSYSEVHANVFYKYVGIQAGRVLSRRTLKAVRYSEIIYTYDRGETWWRLTNPSSKNKTYDKAAAHTEYDYDVFAVGRVGPLKLWKARLTASAGAGIYHWDITDKTVFSGFANAGVDLYKGLGIDASFWYIGKTKPTKSQEIFEAGDNLSRITAGIGYTFGR